MAVRWRRGGSGVRLWLVTAGWRAEIISEQDTVERFGARVTIVDPDALLAAARTEPVELLLGSDFPPPVTGVRITLRPDTADRMLRMVAEIRTGAGDRTADAALRWLALGMARIMAEVHRAGVSTGM